MRTQAAQQVVELLLAAERRASTAACALTEHKAWREALELVIAWRAVPHLVARIQEFRWDLPAAETRSLRQEFLRAYGKSAFQASRAIAAIEGLGKAGIPAAAFKGLASMAVLYGDPRCRTILDADVLIRAEDLARTVECLALQGYSRQGSETLAEYVRFVGNAPGFAGNQAVTLYREGGGEIDLHWALDGSGLSAEEILSRASTVQFMNGSLPVVDAADGFLLSVRHAIRENLAIENVLRDLLDAGLWCRHLAGANQLECAMTHVLETGCQVSALAVTGLLRDYDNNAAAAQAAAFLHAAATPAERKSAAHLAELFHYQLGHGRLGKDVFYLVHSRPWRQISRGLGSGWSEYRRSMRTLEKRLDGEQSLTERVSLLAKSIPGLRALRLARELARVKFG